MYWATFTIPRNFNFGAEYKSTGSFVGARRPHLLGGGREFFAQITMKDDLIVGVK